MALALVVIAALVVLVVVGLGCLSPEGRVAMATNRAYAAGQVSGEVAALAGAAILLAMKKGLTPDPEAWDPQQWPAMADLIVRGLGEKADQRTMVRWMHRLRKEAEGTGKVPPPARVWALLAEEAMEGAGR